MRWRNGSAFCPINSLHGDSRPNRASCCLRPNCQSALNGDPVSAPRIHPPALRRLHVTQRRCRLRYAWFLKRQLSLPVSTISQWCVRRSGNTVVTFALPKTVGYSSKARLVVIMIEVCP